MNPLSMFFAFIVVAFAIASHTYVGFLALASLTFVFPVIWFWTFYTERPRTGQLMYWAVALSGTNFASTAGLAFSVGAYLGAVGMFSFVLLAGVYLFLLSQSVPRAHTSQKRINPRTFAPEPPPGQ